MKFYNTSFDKFERSDDRCKGCECWNPDTGGCESGSDSCTYEPIEDEDDE